MSTNNKNNKFHDNIKVTPYKNLQRLREDENKDLKKKKPNHLLTVTMVFVLIAFTLSSLALGVGGVNGKNGLDGLKGLVGMNGNNGKDGKNGLDGQNGNDGSNGQNGQNGKNPPIAFTSVPERFWGRYNLIRLDGSRTYLFEHIELKANESIAYKKIGSNEIFNTYPLYYGTDPVGSFVRAYLPLNHPNVIMSIDFATSKYCNNAYDEWETMVSEIYRFDRHLTSGGSPSCPRVI